jgi:hypothetical protein
MPHRFSRSKDRIDHRGTNLNREWYRPFKIWILVHNYNIQKSNLLLLYVIIKLLFYQEFLFSQMQLGLHYTTCGYR